MSAEDGLPGFQLALLMFGMGLFFGVVTRCFVVTFNISAPYSVLVLVIGMILGSVTDKIPGNFGTSLSEIKTIDPHLLLSAFIPALIFESSFNINYHMFSREFIQCLLLATIGVLINTFLLAFFAQYVLFTHWTLSQSLLFGSIISATDPVAVVALLRELGASKRLATLIEGESLLNDGTAFILYTIALESIHNPNLTVLNITGIFLKLTFGGVFTGLLIGILCAVWLSIIFNDAKIEISITIFACYLCFYITEIEFQASGVLAVVFLGLVLSKYRLTISPEVESSLHHVWEILGYIANTLIFLFSGIIIITSVLSDESEHSVAISKKDFLFVFVIYIFIHITRLLSLVILWYPIKHSGYGITKNDAIVIVFGGLRGVIGLALGLLTKLEFHANDAEHRFADQVMFHTSGIVFFTCMLYLLHLY